MPYYAIVPIGELSEEAVEPRNKRFRISSSETLSLPLPILDSLNLMRSYDGNEEVEKVDEGDKNESVMEF